MKLTGILDNSLNGQLCLRGFANIKELASISEADYTYQRGLLDRSDISDFLEKQTFLFFPEVILSYKIKYAIKGKTGEEEPIKLIQNGHTYKSNLSNDKTLIKVKKVSFEKAETKSLKVVELSFDESSGKPLHRIDGNHRLNAAEKSNNYKVENMVVPFCILLGTEYYDKDEQKLNSNSEEITFDKAVKVFFHNINTKTIPLTSEQNLKVMIDDSANFEDSELKDIFEGEYPILTRQLINQVPSSMFSGVEHILKDYYRSFYNDVFQRMLENGYKPEKCVKKMSDSLKAIDVLYGENSDLKANGSVGLLTALLWYHMQGKEKFNGFKTWILGNHIFNVAEDVTASSLISLYDQISTQGIKVFVAMPYFKKQGCDEPDEDLMTDYRSIFKKCFEEVQKETGKHIDMWPIMNNEGLSEDMIAQIMEEIEQSDVIIADITNSNPNVLYELGRAHGLKKNCIIVKSDVDSAPCSDIRNIRYYTYKHNAKSTTLLKEVKKNMVAHIQSLQ